MASFAELEKVEYPSPDTLKATLQEYAEGGWSISGQVVVGIINRTPLTAVDKAQLHLLAQKGEITQRRVCTNELTREKESAQYRLVVQRLRL